MERKIDPTTVLAALDRLGNSRAVARELGIHRNSVYAVVRSERGACVRCQKPVAVGKKSCDACLEFDRDRLRFARKQRLRLGICQRCDKPRCALSRIYCEEHRLAHLIESERSRKNKRLKRGTPEPGIPNEQQRRESLVAGYGAAAWQCWQENNGACEGCGASHSEVAIHIHHIDEDQNNNTRENFACLCFFCHRATHLLLSSKKRTGLLAWFERTYPAVALR